MLELGDAADRMGGGAQTQKERGAVCAGRGDGEPGLGCRWWAACLRRRAPQPRRDGAGADGDPGFGHGGPHHLRPDRRRSAGPADEGRPHCHRGYGRRPLHEQLVGQHDHAVGRAGGADGSGGCEASALRGGRRDAAHQGRAARSAAGTNLGPRRRFSDDPESDGAARRHHDHGAWAPRPQSDGRDGPQLRGAGRPSRSGSADRSGAGDSDCGGARLRPRREPSVGGEPAPRRDPIR